MIDDTRLIPMTFDQMFKTVLRTSREYTSTLINLITGIPLSVLKDAEFIDTNIMDEHVTSKHQISDLIISVDDLTINLELNNYKVGTLIKNTSYIFGIYKNMFKVGKEYIDDTLVIQINFNNFDTKIDEELVNEYLIMHTKSHEVLTNMVKIYNINLVKLEKEEYTKSVNKELINFLKIMKAKTIRELKKISGEDKILEKVASEMINYSMDKHMIGLYDKDEVDEKLYNTRISAAKKEGMEEGIQKGMEQGMQEDKMLMAKKMLKENIDVNVISKITGINLTDIDKLKEDNSNT